MNTIAYVPQNQLCTGCGTCAGVCPNESIEMHKSDYEGLYLPQIKWKRCNQCGLCVTVCPGHFVDFEELNLEFFGKRPRDVLLGNYSGCYIGHSNDNDIRYNSSSGGVATQLLIFALEKGIVDGALVARMKKDNPLETEAFIARTRGEILSASKSKYCPVATNVILRQILKENGKFAVVGLPCHIQGIRKAEKIFGMLKKKIALHIGLMCSHTVNFIGTEFLLKKMRIRKEQVTEINYRGKGWPGSMSVWAEGGSNLIIPFTGSWTGYWSVFSPFFFTPTRCTTCPDQTNELSDISLGDAWLPELKHERVGESIIITRTKVADELLDLMDSAGMISVKKVHPKKVKESQAFSLNFKKDNLSGRLSLLKSFGKTVPNIIPKPSSSSLALLGALLPYVSIHASSTRHLRCILEYVPLPVFRLYFGLFKIFFLLTHRNKG